MKGEDDSIFMADKMVLLVHTRAKSWVLSKTPGGDWLLTDALSLRGNFTTTLSSLPNYYDTKNGFTGIISDSDGKKADETADHPLLKLKSNTVVTAQELIDDPEYPKILTMVDAVPEAERQTCQAQKALGLKIGTYEVLVSLVGEELLAPVTQTEDGDVKPYDEWNMHELFDLIEKEALL